MFAASKTSRLVPAGPTSDPYFNYVTSLVHGDGTNGGQNNTFIDSSTNNFTITRNGDTTQGTFGPFNGGNYSNYFDGSGDYLTVPSNAGLQFGTGDFTIEFWWNPSTLASNQPLIYNTDNSAITGTGHYAIVWNISLGMRFYLNTGAAGTVSQGATTGWSVNTWYHVAIVKSGTTLTIYRNGTSIASGANSAICGAAVATYIGGETFDPLYSTGYLSNLRMVKGTALYTANFTPSTAPLNITSNTALLTCASNRFEDLSGANNTITKNGDTAIQTFSPFVQSSSTPTSYSGYFYGTGDYLSVPNNVAFQFGTGDFTVECWVNKSSAANGSIVDVRSGGTGAIPWALYVDASNFPYFYDGTVYTSSVAITNSAWNHIAVVRTSGTLKIFVNGVQGYSQAHSVSLNATGTLLIGGTAAYTIGCISNLRIVKGTALYTANFTPPTTPLTAVSGTSLLTCQSATFVDNSANAFAITVNGSTRPIKGNPFGYTIAATTGYSVASNGGSGYFDGNGDYLNFAGGTATTLSGDFTIEGWIYATNFAALQILICIGDDNTATGALFYIGTEGKLGIFSNGTRFYTGTTIAASNTWMHIAFVRSGTTVTGYLNGVSQGAVTNSSTFSGTNSYIGAEFYTGVVYPKNYGYLTNLRLVKSAVYSGPFVPPQAPVAAVTNTQLLMNFSNASIIDNAEQNDLQTVGAAQISTSIKKYGTGSVYLNGTNSYLLTYYQPSQLMGSGDFTIEGWIYPTASTGVAFRPIVVSSLFSTFGNSDLQYHLYLQTSGYITFQAYVGSTAYTLQYSSATVSLNTWTYVTVVRSGATLTLYIDGTAVSISNISTNTLNSSTSYTLRYGSFVLSNTFYYFAGYLDEFRITKGIARYTANFTPPVAALPNY